MTTKCVSVLTILFLIMAVLIGILHKATIGVKYHESLPVWGIYVTYTVYYTINAPFRLKYYIADQMYENNNPHNLSIELRALQDAFNAFKPFGSKHPGPDDESTFLEIYDKVCNALGYLVPLQQNTSIMSHLLLAQHFTQLLRDVLYDTYDLTIPNQAHATLSPRVFVPRTVKFQWIIGDNTIDNSTNAPTILYLHGGGYVLCGSSHLGFASKLSVATNRRILFINYSKPPHSTIPKQVNEILTVYFYLINYMNISPNKILIGGDSAGGGLTVLLLQKLSMLGLNNIYPFGIFLLSPWVDLTMESESWRDLDDFDVVLDYGYVQRCGIMAVGYDKNKLNCPLHSALHNDHMIERLPNVFIMASQHEALFNDSQKLVNKLQNDCNDNCDSITFEIEIYRPHVSAIFVGLFDEAQMSFDKLVTIIQDWYK